MKKTQATRKSGEELRAKIANVLLFQVSDPRLQMVTVTGCDVSKDREVADVYISADASRYEEVEEGLQAAKGRIRSLVGKGLGWRTTPELRFHIDTTVDEAMHIAELLDQQ